MVPHRRLETAAIENGGLHTVDEHTPKPHLANHLIEWPLRDEVLIVDVTQPVERGAKQRKQVPFELVRRVATIGASDMVARDEKTHATDTDEDPDELGRAVADLHEDEGDGDDDDDGPEVDELGGEDGGVAVGEDGEIVPFDVDEGEDEVAPAVTEQEGEVFLEAVPVDGVCREDDIHEGVVQKSLEGWK